MQKPINIFIFLLFSGFSLLFVSCNDSYKEEYPVAKKGILDLRNWDFIKNGNIKLDGQWEFYWQNLYKPSDFKSKLIDNPDYIKVPRIWNNKGSDTKKYKLNDYTTYRLKVLLNADNKFHFNVLVKDEIGNDFEISANQSLIEKIEK